jgi:hypothetical protein
VIESNVASSACPVQVLDDEHRRPWPQLELRKQQHLDLVRRRPGRERLLERRRDAADQIPDRAERPRDREVVAGAVEDASGGLDAPQERGDERGLADPGLARHEDDAPVPARRRVACVRQRGQCSLALEEFHGQRYAALRAELASPDRLRAPVRTS